MAERRPRRDFSLADRIFDRRTALGLSQLQVAERAMALGYPLSEASISRLENGQRPFYETLEVLAKALECSDDFLLGRVKEPTKRLTYSQFQGGSRVNLSRISPALRIIRS